MPEPEPMSSGPSSDAVSRVGFDAWREAISSAFVPLVASPESPVASFRGALDSTTLGDVQLSEVTGDRSRVRRSPAMIRSADPGVVKVGLQLSGHSIVHQDGRCAVLAPGDLAVYDTSVEYDLDLADSFDMLVAVVPRSALRVADRELTDATARTIGTAVGVGALLRPLMLSLRAGAAGTGSGVAASLVEDAVSDLVSALIRSSAPIEALGAGETILLSARTFIEANLDDPGLSPAVVAAHHHVSVRYLQKLFAYDGLSVATFIRQRRLDRCRRDLADPAQRHRSIGAVSASHGLVDASHFSRLFRQTYGLSPRQFREVNGLADV